MLHVLCNAHKAGHTAARWTNVQTFDGPKEGLTGPPSSASENWAIISVLPCRNVHTRSHTSHHNRAYSMSTRHAFTLISSVFDYLLFGKHWIVVMGWQCSCGSSRRNLLCWSCNAQIRNAQSHTRTQNSLIKFTVVPMWKRILSSVPCVCCAFCCHNGQMQHSTLYYTI